MHKLILVRHGESVWNMANRFTGWVDVELSENGIKEAHHAAKLIKDEGLSFDCAYTSVLKRAIKTLWTILEDTDLMWIPVKRSWRLNERHYGQLQGLNKKETADKYGDEQVYIWRRSFDTPPEAFPPSDDRHPSHDPRYAEVSASELPGSEALKHCQDRVLPYWESDIAPAIKSGKKVIIVAHGNSLRALVKYLDNIPNDEIAKLNIPTGLPLIYELDDNLKPLKSYYLGDQEAAAKKAEAVANQAK